MPKKPNKTEKKSNPLTTKINGVECFKTSKLPICSEVDRLYKDKFKKK